VTFVWGRELDEPPPRQALLVGTFAPLYDRIPLRHDASPSIRMSGCGCRRRPARYMLEIDSRLEQDRRTEVGV
jgi:hypothetical protein